VIKPNTVYKDTTGMTNRMNIGIINLHIMVVVISEFHEHRLSGGCTYVVRGNGNYRYVCAVKPSGISKVKNAMVRRL